MTVLGSSSEILRRYFKICDGFLLLYPVRFIIQNHSFIQLRHE